jgi:hypothetical protein
MYQLPPLGRAGYLSVTHPSEALETERIYLALLIVILVEPKALSVKFIRNFEVDVFLTASMISPF